MVLIYAQLITKDYETQIGTQEHNTNGLWTVQCIEENVRR